MTEQRVIATDGYEPFDPGDPLHRIHLSCGHVLRSATRPELGELLRCEPCVRGEPRTVEPDCLCGAPGLLADTENWRAPLCVPCWSLLDRPELEPFAPLRQIMAAEEVPSGLAPVLRGDDVRLIGRLACGHRVTLDAWASGIARTDAVGPGRVWIGRASPCGKCAQHTRELALAVLDGSAREKDVRRLAELVAGLLPAEPEGG